MIRKLLVANRGEIAIRVFRTCRDMGIGTVAVFSDADESARFVAAADEAFRLGPAPSAESYLRVDRVLEAARATGADAVHPGYGFLAENDAFAQAVLDAGLVWVGPKPAAIRGMGLKREAKIRAAELGVPVIPGYQGEDQSEGVLRAAAIEIGFPVLLKASAGGGGRGMRVVRAEGEIAAAIESARREAEGAFGNGTLIVEKYLERPRHVEVQILGDEHGNVVHLFERECSVQRRHQKIVEESPCVALDDARRRRMGADAVTLAKAMRYSSAGTVELVLAPNGEHYFLEVNTRLQVEHPVTEAILPGLDLVEEQIRVARGEALRFTQEDLEARREGACIEVRLCAEDPANGFLPGSGVLADFDVPDDLARADWLRVETGVARGSEIPVHYDSMIAKVIARGPTRADAIARARRALGQLSVAGIATNRELLLRILDHPTFVRAEHDTGWLERELASLLGGEPPLEHAALAATLHASAHRRDAGLLPGIAAGFRVSRFRRQRVEWTSGERRVATEWADLGGDRYDVVSGALAGRARIVRRAPESITIELPSGHVVSARVVRDDLRAYVRVGDACVVLDEAPLFPDRDAEAAADGCVAPMPGKVVKLLVEKGQRVDAGDTLLVMEAMKMEHAVKAPHAGVVTELRVAAGEQVDGGALLAVVTE